MGCALALGLSEMTWSSVFPLIGPFLFWLDGLELNSQKETKLSNHPDTTEMAGIKWPEERNTIYTDLGYCACTIRSGRRTGGITLHPFQLGA